MKDNLNEPQWKEFCMNPLPINIFCYLGKKIEVRTKITNHKHSYFWGKDIFSVGTGERDVAQR